MDVPWQDSLAEEVPLTAGTASARVAPGRGALVTGLAFGEQEVLFLDHATLVDPKANVRGGIPILFPNAGPLPAQRFVETGTELLQHGFVRRYPWEVKARQPNALSLHFTPTPATAAHYPFMYNLDLDVTLSANALRLTLTIANRDQRPLPVASGWHPYFAVPHALKSQIASAMLGPTWARITDDEEFTFAVPFTAPCDIALPAGPRLWLRASPEHSILQMWSLPGHDFVCFEPFVGPNNTLNDPHQRLNIPPGQTRTLWIEIASATE